MCLQSHMICRVSADWRVGITFMKIHAVPGTVQRVCMQATHSAWWVSGGGVSNDSHARCLGVAILLAGTLEHSPALTTFNMGMISRLRRQYMANAGQCSQKISSAEPWHLILTCFRNLGFCV